MDVLTSPASSMNRVDRLAFNGIAIGLIVVSRRLPWFSRSAAPAAEAGSGDNPTAAYVAPLLGIALASMIGGAFSVGGFDRLYAVRVAAGAAVLWSFRGRYAGLRALCTWQAVAVGVGVFAMWT